MPRIIKRRDWPGWGFKEEWPRYGLGIEWPPVGPIPARDIEREVIYNQIVVPAPEPEEEPEETTSTAPLRHVTHTSTLNALGPAIEQATANTYGSAVWPSANRAIFVPFTVDEDYTVVKMGLANGAAVSGNVDLGIYDSSFTRLVSTGSTAQSGTTQMQSFDVTDTDLSPGWYYMALAVSNTTAQVFCLNPSAFEAFMGGVGCFQQAAALPLPSTATPAAVSSNYLPWFGMTARTLFV